MKIGKKYRKALAELIHKKTLGEPQELLAKAEQQYQKFMSEIPDIGGKDNMQFEDLNFAVVFFSLHEACNRQLTPDDLDWFAWETMVKPAEKTGRLINWNKPLMSKIAGKMYSSYKKKIDEHVAKGEWGNTWRFEINPEHHKEGFALRTRLCPNLDFVKKYGYEEFMPVLCRQDHKIAQAMHGRLVRYHTVANGDDYCDWWYFGDQMPVTKEEKEYIAKQKNKAL